MGRKMNHSAPGCAALSRLGRQGRSSVRAWVLGFAGTTGPRASNLCNDAYLYRAPTNEE
jgi:hypothetical protein